MADACECRTLLLECLLTEIFRAEQAVFEMIEGRPFAENDVFSMRMALQQSLISVFLDGDGVETGRSAVMEATHTAGHLRLKIFEGPTASGSSSGVGRCVRVIDAYERSEPPDSEAQDWSQAI